LDDNGGWMKVLIGEYENLASKIPNYSKQLIYHIHLNSGKQFTIKGKKDLEYAAFLFSDNAVINGSEYQKEESFCSIMKVNLLK
jgi:redox-sensitive bicupin YhaK (pirin superfamily)